MLTSKEKDIVKATVPLLETGGEALTIHFYKILLNEYPEVRPLFNQVHQDSGSQPRALAAAILAYARNIDRLEALGPLANQIVNKHVSLQILPEHYPMVGSCLLQAIEEVIGQEIATREVIDAWAKAYQQLADILISAEEKVYSEQEKTPGGWRGGRKFRIHKKVAESAEITSFFLKPVDGNTLMDFVPGQYIGLQLCIDGKEIRRNYSLSAAPNKQSYRISVKRESHGIASRHLHQNLKEGDTLTLFPPSGNFTLKSNNDKPLIFVSGGVGITPTLAMLQAALDLNRPITFVHYARDEQSQAFKSEVNAMKERCPLLKTYWVLEKVEDQSSNKPDAIGRPDAKILSQWLPANRDVDAYFLGPKPFMAFIKRTLKALGVPEEQSYYEFFGPAEALD